MKLLKLLAGCAFSVCLLAGGVFASAAAGDTGAVMDPTLPAPEERVSVGEPGAFTEQEDGAFRASTQFYLQIESSPYIGPPAKDAPAGTPGSVRSLVLLNLPEHLSVIEDFQIPLSIPSTGDRSAPESAFALLAAAATAAAAALLARRRPRDPR